MTDGKGYGILSETVCRLGEGPTYDAASDTLYWFDITGKKLLERRVATAEERVHSLPEMASALAVVDPERQLLATETGLYLRDARTGALTLHCPIEADNPRTRSNDARVHPCGAFWVGTMSKTSEREAGAIYWYFRGELRQIVPRISIPNAICFSADGSTAYFTGSIPGVLHRIGCDPETGLPRGEPSIFHDHRGQAGSIDGAVIDADGVLWNACWGAGRVDAYAPDGKLLGSHPLPATRTTCPVFIGADAGRLAVTSAWEGADEAERASQPDAGKTFLLDVPVKGRFDPRVAL